MSQDKINAHWSRIGQIDEEAARRIATMPINDSADRLDWHDSENSVPHPSIPADELGGPFGKYVPLPIRRRAELAALQAERGHLVAQIRALEMGVPS